MFDCAMLEQLMRDRYGVTTVDLDLIVRSSGELHGGYPGNAADWACGAVMSITKMPPTAIRDLIDSGNNDFVSALVQLTYDDGEVELSCDQGQAR